MRKNGFLNKLSEKLRSERSVRNAKIIISLALLYHLFAVMVLPNADSILGRQLGRYLIPYTNTLGMSSSWKFFAPGPNPSISLEYQVETDDSYDILQLEVKPYPPKKKPFSWSENYNRRLAGMQFLALSKERFNHFFIPFLCRQEPGAKVLHVRSIVDKVPALEKAEFYGGGLTDMFERMDTPTERYDCPGEDEEL